MGGDLVKAVIEKIPSWVFSIIGIGIVALFFYVSFLLSKGARKISSVLDKENNIKDMQEKIRSLEKENERFNGMSSQLSTAMENLTAHISTLDLIRVGSKSSVETRYMLTNLLAKMTDSLAADIKFSPGEKHRCGYWIFENENRLLRLFQGSSGFPNGYINNRELSVDSSVAGRAYRLRKTVYEPNVEEAMEWSKNPDSLSRYKAIISIPVFPFGVLTIDAINPMMKETIEIGEAYAALFAIVSSELFIFNAYIPQEIPEDEIFDEETA
ncbi:GAF domain-containing protein [Paenibacillus solani]|uniref:GAF domain-containing protein n=1 Tax=Paenibacillus solani TaxID=1705565 RepID=UPI003D2C319F